MCMTTTMAYRRKGLVYGFETQTDELKKLTSVCARFVHIENAVCAVLGFVI
jgi:hypothetical protein